MHWMTGSVLLDKIFICSGQGAILSASLHYWVVYENSKALYLIRAGSCLPWRKIAVAWNWPHRVSWVRICVTAHPWLSRLQISQAISTGIQADLFRTLVFARVLSDKFHGRTFKVSWSLPSKSFPVNHTNLILLSTLNTKINKSHTQYKEHMARVSDVIVWVKIKRGWKIVKISGMTLNTWFFFYFIKRPLKARHSSDAWSLSHLLLG
jgi:hypothetical protein